jgi:CelD/BcsL family acetyltransferase involved in cellulose biosynthesis
MCHVREINDFEELETLRLPWRSLHAQTRGASFFQTLDWLLTYWRHYGEKQRLRVLVVESNNEILGILPLVVRTEATRLGSIRVLTYPLHNWGTFYGPLGPNPTATLTAGLAHIGRTTRDWDMIDLRWVNRDQVDHRRTATALELASLSAAEHALESVALVKYEGTWEEYWLARPRKWRANLRRSQKLLAGRGQLRVVRYRPAGAAHGEDDPRWDLYEACERVAAQSWQASSGQGNTMSSSSVSGFLRDAHTAAVKLGMVDLGLLYVDEEAVAFIYNYHCEGQLFGLRMGYNPAFDGAGSVLMQDVLADSFQRGDAAFNLGAGYLEWKRPWLTTIVASYHYTHYAPRALRAQALRLKRWLSARLPAHRSLEQNAKAPV